MNDIVKISVDSTLGCTVKNSEMYRWIKHLQFSRVRHNDDLIADQQTTNRACLCWRIKFRNGQIPQWSWGCLALYSYSNLRMRILLMCVWKLSIVHRLKLLLYKVRKYHSIYLLKHNFLSMYVSLSISLQRSGKVSHKSYKILGKLSTFAPASISRTKNV